MRACPETDTREQENDHDGRPEQDESLFAVRVAVVRI
jgi:hypothetical protein